MKTIGLVICLLVITSGYSQRTETISDVMDIVTNKMEGVIVTNPLLGKYFNQYLADLSNIGVDVPRDLLNIKYLFADEGFEGSGRITKMGIAYKSGDTHIIFSNEIIADEAKLKTVMYKVLTEKLELGLTSKDSKILDEHIHKITEKDYKKLISLIVAEWERQFIVIKLSKEDFNL